MYTRNAWADRAPMATWATMRPSVVVPRQRGRSGASAGSKRPGRLIVFSDIGVGGRWGAACCRGFVCTGPQLRVTESSDFGVLLPHLSQQAATVPFQLV